jgi:hypothetical protein
VKFKQALADFWDKARKSATIWTGLFWSVVTVAAENVAMLSGVVSAKWYPFIVIGTMALARMRSLGKKE